MAETQESNPSKLAEGVVKDKHSDTDIDPDSWKLLDRLYVYQNNQTGHVAPTARLSTRQLCRILCPPGNDDDDDTSNNIDSFQRTVTPETQLLALETSSSHNENRNNSSLSYSSEGWKQAKMVPILQQATALWYYEDNSSSDPTVKGPVSCRKLAELYFAHGEENAILQDTTSSCRCILTKSTRVYSEAVSPAWSAIQDVAYLQLALHAFHSSSPPAAATTAVADQDTEQAEDAASIMAEECFAVEQQQQQQEQEPTLTIAAKTNEKQIKDELEAFLSSTDHLGIANSAVDVEDDEAYESDNGTRYIKDVRTGNWVHEALIMAHRQSRMAEEQKSISSKNKKQSHATKSASSATTSNPDDNSANNNNPTKKRKKSKSQFAARNAKNWIYVTGLPSTCTEEQVQDFFSQAGIIELDPETLRPKIKLYRYKESDVMITNNNDNINNRVVVGQCKGDASICFARWESVDLAITLLDEAPFQPPSFPTDHTTNSSNGISQQQQSSVRVQRAKFERHGNQNGPQDDDDDHNVNDNAKRTKVFSNAKRKVAKLAAIQARDWDDGEFNGRLTGGRKGLRIIVLKHVFSSKHAKDDAALARLEQDLLAKCQPFGTVEKITIFATNPDGVVIVKFASPGAASEAIKALDGKVWGQEEAAAAATTSKSTDVVQANFWDGVTDYTVRNEAKEEEEMEKRHDQFGQWLDNQELPEELRLKTEDA